MQADRTIKILHALGYTDPNGGRDPIPVLSSAAVGDTTRSLQLRSATGAETPASSGVKMLASTGVEMWMAITTKTVLIE